MGGRLSADEAYPALSVPEESGHDHATVAHGEGEGGCCKGGGGTREQRRRITAAAAEVAAQDTAMTTGILDQARMLRIAATPSGRRGEQSKRCV